MGKLICAECKKILGDSQTEKDSHGLCRLCARIAEESFFTGHEYEEVGDGYRKGDDATHQCRHCGGRVEIFEDGTMGVRLAGPCTKRRGIYTYAVARTNPRADRSLDDCNLGFVWNK